VFEALVLNEIQQITLVGTLLLIALPGAITDYQSGKIRNWLILFLLVLVLGGIILMWKTLDLTFWISGGVVLGFGYVLYLYDRWGAGDGKYFIVLGWILLLLEKILQISSDLLWFTLLSFGGLALWIIANLLWKMD
jgi:Flp pilus assembly protein protease CpaA